MHGLCVFMFTWVSTHLCVAMLLLVCTHVTEAQGWLWNQLALDETQAAPLC